MVMLVMMLVTTLLLVTAAIETSSCSCVFFLGCFKGFFLPPESRENLRIRPTFLPKYMRVNYGVWATQKVGN